MKRSWAGPCSILVYKPDFLDSEHLFPWAWLPCASFVERWHVLTFWPHFSSISTYLR